MIRMGKTIDDVEMVPVRLDHRVGRGTQASPDIGKQRALAQELGALAPPTQQVMRALSFGRSSAGLSACASASSIASVAFMPVRRIGRRSCTPEIDTTCECDWPPWHQGRRRRRHAADEVAAGRVPGQHHRPFDHLRCLADR